MVKKGKATKKQFVTVNKKYAIEYYLKQADQNIFIRYNDLNKHLSYQDKKSYLIHLWNIFFCKYKNTGDIFTNLSRLINVEIDQQHKLFKDFIKFDVDCYSHLPTSVQNAIKLSVETNEPYNRLVERVENSLKEETNPIQIRLVKHLFDIEGEIDEKEVISTEKINMFENYNFSLKDLIDLPFYEIVQINFNKNYKTLGENWCIKNNLLHSEFTRFLNSVFIPVGDMVTQSKILTAAFNQARGTVNKYYNSDFNSCYQDIIITLNKYVKNNNITVTTTDEFIKNYLIKNNYNELIEIINSITKIKFKIAISVLKDILKYTPELGFTLKYPLKAELQDALLRKRLFERILDDIKNKGYSNVTNVFQGYLSASKDSLYQMNLLDGDFLKLLTRKLHYHKIHFKISEAVQKSEDKPFKVLYVTRINNTNSINEFKLTAFKNSKNNSKSDDLESKRISTSVNKITDSDLNVEECKINLRTKGNNKLSVRDNILDVLNTLKFDESKPYNIEILIKK